MSEKKEKDKRHTMQLPIYNPSSQLDYINKICQEMNFSSEKFLTFILADWILSFETTSLDSNAQTAFMAFLANVEKHKERFEKLRGVINEKSK